MGIVAVSPSSTWRVLSKAGMLNKWNQKPSLEGTGFVQPLLPHDHWHVDVFYLNIRDTFYYLCSFLDGCSRSIIHWEIREQMTEPDIEIILQRAKEKYPAARRIVEKYIEHYNTVRLHSAIGYVAPADKLNCRDLVILKERDRKLEEARELRKQKRQQAYSEIGLSQKSDYNVR